MAFNVYHSSKNKVNKKSNEYRYNSTKKYFFVKELLNACLMKVN